VDIASNSLPVAAFPVGAWSRRAFGSCRNAKRFGNKIV